jgi:hypothetical protein
MTMGIATEAVGTVMLGRKVLQRRAIRIPTKSSTMLALRNLVISRMLFLKLESPATKAHKLE